jgi:rhodanese-related sulfurtransferase
MKNILGLMLLMVVAAVPLVSAQTSQTQTPSGRDAAKKQEDQFPNIKKLSSQELDQLLDKHPDTLLLDVRESDEATRNGSFKGAIHIPLDQLEQRLSELPKDRVILPFCNRGGRGSKAADLLEKRGYKIAGATGVQTYSATGGTKYLVAAESDKK